MEKLSADKTKNLGYQLGWAINYMNSQFTVPLVRSFMVAGLIGMIKLDGNTLEQVFYVFLYGFFFKVQFDCQFSLIV